MATKEEMIKKKLKGMRTRIAELEEAIHLVRIRVSDERQELRDKIYEITEKALKEAEKDG